MANFKLDQLSPDYKSSHFNKTHGFASGPKKSRLYIAWRNMKQRCLNSKRSDFYRYGGRGIKVCAHWMSFENFAADMGNAPSAKHTLERKDNSKGYEPGNCQWSTMAAQCNNRRTNVRIAFNGREQTIREWEAELNFKNGTLWWRLKHGWPINKAMTPIS